MHLLIALCLLSVMVCGGSCARRAGEAAEFTMNGQPMRYVEFITSDSSYPLCKAGTENVLTDLRAVANEWPSGPDGSYVDQIVIEYNGEDGGEVDCRPRDMFFCTLQEIDGMLCVVPDNERLPSCFLLATSSDPAKGTVTFAKDALMDQIGAAGFVSNASGLLLFPGPILEDQKLGVSRNYLVYIDALKARDG